MRQIVGTAAQWLSFDLVLGKGELAVEQTGTTTKIKIGDGTNKYSALPFVSGGVDLSAISANFVNLAGSTMTGPLVLSGAPTADLHAATKKYADNAVAAAKTQSDTDYVNVAGDTMTGALTLSGPPTADLHAATKKYTDDKLAAAKTQADTDYVNVAGDTMTGLLTLSGEPTSDSHAATKKYVDSLDASVVKIAGSTMTGLLTLSGAPTSDLHAATKKYADSLIPKATGASQILVSDSTTGFPWQVGDLDEGRY
jgi:hypothetical protein